MKTNTMPEIQEVVQAGHYRPAVSIIMPFGPKISLKTEIARSLKIAADKVEQELENTYPNELGKLVMQKLKTVIQALNFDTHKKSIAIYVSPVFEKVLYLDMAVEEKIIVDDSFEIRDLVYSKKQIHKFLVLLLSSKERSIYLGDSSTFARILVNSPDAAKAFENDIPEKVANFSDTGERKEIMMHKFLHHIDHSLGIILNTYHLPLFILGTERITGHFKKITKHAEAVIEYVHGNYEDLSPQELKVLLEPHVADWKKVMQKDIINQLQNAAGKKRLSIGMRDVWRKARDHKGSLLAVEKNFMYAVEHGSGGHEIYKAENSSNSLSYIKDAVDDVIEKVLENGGDVEFVDEGLLKEYGHIALIQYY